MFPIFEVMKFGNLLNIHVANKVITATNVVTLRDDLVCLCTNM